MKLSRTAFAAVAVTLGVSVAGAPAAAATLLQVGASGKSYASSAVACGVDQLGALGPFVEAGLFNPKHEARALVLLNGTYVTTVTTAHPSTDVWLVPGNNSVMVSLSKKTSDTYAFTVAPGTCDDSGNTFSADGIIEYAASGKTEATVPPGCAWNPATGLAQPFINLIDHTDASGRYYLINVSVNDVPLVQLGPTRPSTPVFLSAGWNIISAANASASTDYYVRDGGTGTCTLP